MMVPTGTALETPVFEDVAHLTEEGVLGPGQMRCARTDAAHLVDVVRVLRDRRGFTHLSLLTAAEVTGDTPGLDMVYAFTRRADKTTVALKVALDDSNLSVPTLSALWSGAAPLEREVYDLFGVTFDGHQNLRRIQLRDDFEGHPLRKSFPMTEGGVTPEAVAKAVLSHGEGNHDDVRPESPFVAVTAGSGRDSMHSQRLILNMGPQHPSTHGVLHVWLALEGERVMAAEPTHGYLHRCIEKLCEGRQYKAITSLMDRCDYVSGFHTELAYLLALEELAEIEVTPKADYLRVAMSELVRITSHHTWFAAAGLDTGALTPFLYAFIDREIILDFLEAVTGARMMFNYFRPGGVKDDIPAGVLDDFLGFLKNFDKQMDKCESLLTENEIFRARTRGIGILPPKVVEDYCVTGPMARASGVDVDLRRDEPYAAYDKFTVNVPVTTAGDTFDRYLVRVAEMRESARIAYEALAGLPEGPVVSEGVPRVLRPPAGEAYRRVESSRGELGVYLVSDGSDKPWRLKVRSPAFSNLHSAPYILEGTRVGDVVAALGSVDVVMGEIDR